MATDVTVHNQNRRIVSIYRSGFVVEGIERPDFRWQDRFLKEVELEVLHVFGSNGVGFDLHYTRSDMYEWLLNDWIARHMPLEGKDGS